MIFSNKSQMIHVISEVVVLIGFTFYFTSKLNKLSNELVKMNEIIKREVRNNSTVGQEEKIQYLNSGIEDRPYLEKLLELSNNYKHKLSN